MVPRHDCCDVAASRRAHPCPGSPGEWDDPAWKTLAFAVSGPRWFRYAYTAAEDGHMFIASALANLECRDDFTLYELRGEVVNGEPVWSLTEQIYEADPTGFVVD